MCCIARIDVGLILGPVHETVNALIDQPVLGVAANHIRVIQLSIAVFRVVLKQGEHR